MFKPNTLELTLFAFKTEKGTFTLSGSNSDGTDEWREVGTSNFHKWNRSNVYNWFKNGKINPVKEANSITWLTSQYIPPKKQTQMNF